MKRLYWWLLVIPFMAGCTTFQGVQTQAVDALVKGATKYCDETSPTVRANIREEFNSKFGGTAEINCP